MLLPADLASLRKKHFGAAGTDGGHLREESAAKEEDTLTCLARGTFTGSTGEGEALSRRCVLSHLHTHTVRKRCKFLSRVDEHIPRTRSLAVFALTLRVRYRNILGRR